MPEWLYRYRYAVPAERTLVYKLLFHLNPKITGTAPLAFMMGYLLPASSLIASILLIYAVSHFYNVVSTRGSFLIKYAVILLVEI